jgi:hypothetical protein
VRRETRLVEAKMKNRNALIGAAILISFGMPLTAEMGMSQPQANPPAAAQQKTMPQKTESQNQFPNDKKQTLVGCLTKAPATVSKAPSTPSQSNSKGSSMPGTQGLSNPKVEGTVAPIPVGFLLKRQGTGEEIAVEGLSQLSVHTGHMVQLTGTMSQKNGKDILEVSEIKHVAYSCPGDKPGLGRTESKSKNPAGSGY